MSIRVEQVTTRRVSDSYVGAKGTDILDDLGHDIDFLSVARHVLRDQECNMIPVIVAARKHPVNQWGHTMTVEVEYSTNGWRAIYGVDDRGPRLALSCYAN